MIVHSSMLIFRDTARTSRSHSPVQGLIGKRQLFCGAKNYSVVRKAVGYLRYDTAEELESLNVLYRYKLLFNTL